MRKFDAIYDYVVIGGGSAGCVVASRLSERPENSVLLIEAGPSDWHPLIHMPSGEAFLVGGTFDWKFLSEPEPCLGGHQVPLPRGRVLGGSSSINGQVFVRGHRGDFDEWLEAGCAGWGWSDVLPYFKKLESWKGAPDPLRGTDGPIKVAHGRFRDTLCEAFLAAGAEAGYPVNPDYNSGTQEGFSRTQYTHTHRRPTRCSASRAYLWPARRRKNLTVWTRSRALRLVLAGKQVVAVEIDRRGARMEVVARREVILSAGAYSSPHLLMMSGIGDTASLSKFGIAGAHHLRGVGENLQDHVGAGVQHRCRKRVTYYGMKNPLKLSAALVQYGVTGGGPLSVFPMTTMAFLKSEAGVQRPDIQIHLFPAAVPGRGSTELFAPYHGYNIHWCLLRPASRGRVGLRSADPYDTPMIRPNFLSHASDRILNRRAFHLARDLHRQKVFDDFRGDETEPGRACRTDEEIDAFVASLATSHFHPVGTCKMGTDDMSVVDPKLRVHGLDGLRVVDASVMPSLVGGNTNAASIMIGEKGAAIILASA